MVSLRAHIQVKQIVNAVFGAISLILGRINAVGAAYPDSNLARQIMVTYATVFSIPDVGDQLVESITRQVVTIFDMYLFNPAKHDDLALSPWFVILRHLHQVIFRKFFKS